MRIGKKYVFALILLISFSLSAQNKYQKSLDSLAYYFKYVKIIDRIDQKPLKDSLSFIETKYKNYSSTGVSKGGIKGKSIVFLQYAEHTCILDLNAYDSNSIVKKDGFVVLVDSSKHIYFNLTRRIGG